LRATAGAMKASDERSFMPHFAFIFALSLSEA
jgi:hypothetical protein